MSKTDTKSPSHSTSIDDEPEVLAEKLAEQVAITDHGDNFSGDKAELTINSGEGAAGRHAVFVGINGHGFNIPRDIKVIVPQEVVDQLDNCLMDTYQSVDGGKMELSKVKRFSTNVRSLPRTAKK